jgi:hypothetical protein
MGRKPYFTYQDVFFRLYLRQLIWRRPIRKVTCIGFTGEGAGSQALMMMNAINFARAFGLTYIHTPFAEIAHADRPMREWVTAWETHFNLGAGDVATDGDTRETVNFAFNFSDLLPLFGVDDLTHMFNTTIPEFRRKYYSNKSPRANRVLTICVHVRRGDVTRENAGRWTNNSFIAETIAKVRAAIDAHCIKYKICILSQGDHGGLAELVDVPGTEIFLDADPIWSMQEAIEADILIMAKSSFSYVAALISDGIKITEERGYPPMSGWVLRGSNGEFDCAAFEHQLERLIEHRAINWIA